MKSRAQAFVLPAPAKRALSKLGADIASARKRRRIPTATMSEMASISRMTLNKIEKGEPGVAAGSYATVLFILGLSDRLADLADARSDAIGLELDAERLPQRIRRVKKKKTAKIEK